MVLSEFKNMYLTGENNVYACDSSVYFIICYEIIESVQAEGMINLIDLSQ